MPCREGRAALGGELIFLLRLPLPLLLLLRAPCNGVNLVKRGEPFCG